MVALADRAGWADALIVNTCAVTGEAEAQARQAMRNLVTALEGAGAIASTGGYNHTRHVSRLFANLYYRQANTEIYFPT